MRMRLTTPDEMNCAYVDWKFVKFTNNSAQINPIVPKIRIGGNAVTVSSPALLSALNATELARPIVGMKNAMERV